MSAPPRRGPINIQDGWLFQTLKENREIAVALTTGKFFKGTVRRFDRYAIIFFTSDQEMLVYKHAIVSIVDVPGATARTDWNGAAARPRRPPVGAHHRDRPTQGW